MAKPGLGSGHRTIAAIIRRRAAKGEPCWICQLPIDTRPEDQGGPPPRTRWAFSADHIAPRSKGGHSVLSNYRPAHYGCNAGRGNRTAGNPPSTTWRPRQW